MSRLLAAITLLLSIILTILVTIACSVPIIIAGIVKLLLPVPVWRAVSAFCNFMMYCWCEGLAILLCLNPHLKWDVKGLESEQEELVSADLQSPQLGGYRGVMRTFSQTYPDEQILSETAAGLGAFYRGLLGAGYAVYETLFAQLFDSSSGASR
jgi:hypothetical protein